jgi:hypothetical protein
MQWIEGPVALRRRLDHSEATPAKSEVELQFCDDPQIAHALRCQNAADEMFLPIKHRNPA